MAAFRDDAEYALDLLASCPPADRLWLLRELRDLMIHLEGQKSARLQPSKKRKKAPISPYIGRRVWAPVARLYFMTGEFVQTMKTDGACFVFKILAVASREELSSDGDAIICEYPTDREFVHAQW